MPWKTNHPPRGAHQPPPTFLPNNKAKAKPPAKTKVHRRQATHLVTFR